MTSIYDSFGRRRLPHQNDPRRQNTPTVEDYQRLLRASRKLQMQNQELESTLEELRAQSAPGREDILALEQELEIKNEALHKQTEDLKQTESELVWTRAALQQLQAEQEEADADTWQERHARLQAEIENMRKRWEQRFVDELATARHQILLDMLPLADHLDMALTYADGLEVGESQEFIENIRATHQAFMNTLKRYGITRVDDINTPFDPAIHEAMGHVENEDIPEDHVAKVLQPGYLEGEKLVRPARVLVSKQV